eukprot:gene3814-4401_t
MYVYKAHKHLFDDIGVLYMAVQEGRLDVFKVLELESYPKTVLKTFPRKFLQLALCNGRLAMFQYLLTHKRQNDGVPEMPLPLEPSVDYDDLAVMLKMFIGFINSKELTRMWYQEVPINVKSLRGFCEEVFAPTRCSCRTKRVLVDCLDAEPADPTNLRQSFTFFLEMMKVYGNDAPEKSQQLATQIFKGQCLSDTGMIYFVLFDVLVCKQHQLSMVSQIRKGLFIHVASVVTKDMDSFLRYMINKDGDLSSICTYGTIEMVERAHCIMSSGKRSPISSKNLDHPRTLEINRYIKEHGLFKLNQVSLLNHFVSMGDVEAIEFNLDTHPAPGLRLEVNYHIARHPIDKRIEILSQLQRSSERWKTGHIYNIFVYNCVLGLKVSHLEHFSTSSLERMRFDLRVDSYPIDQSIIRYLFGIFSDVEGIMDLLAYASEMGMLDIIQWQLDRKDRSEAVANIVAQRLPQLLEIALHNHQFHRLYSGGDHVDNIVFVVWSPPLMVP